MALKGAATMVKHATPMGIAQLNVILKMALWETVPKINCALSMGYVAPHVHHPTTPKEIVLMVICVNTMVYAALVRFIIKRYCHHV